MPFKSRSDLWDAILVKDRFNKIDLKNFKKDGVNSRIAQYSHKTHSILFLKNILFQMAKNFDFADLKLLEKVHNRDLGGGITISYKNIDLDLDYLMALEEILFLAPYVREIETITEIGAGYGRTCHMILSLFTNIREYRIIDFPKMLDLQNKYLYETMGESLCSKIKYYSLEDVYPSKSDLIINIDSMQEMNHETVFSYLNYTNESGNLFYSKNTVGKFSPLLCDWEESPESIMAMKSGILKNVINIFCPRALESAKDRFLQAFTPSQNWSVLKHSYTQPWSHYYQALYKKNA